MRVSNSEVPGDQPGTTFTLPDRVFPSTQYSSFKLCYAEIFIHPVDQRAILFPSNCNASNCWLGLTCLLCAPTAFPFSSHKFSRSPNLRCAFSSGGPVTSRIHKDLRDLEKEHRDHIERVEREYRSEIDTLNTKLVTVAAKSLVLEVWLIFPASSSSATMY